ncbi:MAG: CHAT domain-containing protein [Anaerolineae bacterium]|nr:CHAT domain-containing protein [Anaerolineae bacterium]
MEDRSASVNQDWADLEIRIFARDDDLEKYPIDITLNREQEFPRGYLDAHILPWHPGGTPSQDGQKLFDALFADAELRSAWEKAQERAPQRRIRLRIEPDAGELHNLPWELLTQGAVMLAAQTATPFSRYLPIALPWKSGAAETCPIRVLVVISNPDDLLDRYDLPPVDVDAERAILESALATIGYTTDCTTAGQEELQISFLEAPVTPKKLEEALRDGYHVLHFVGHGAFNAKLGQAALFMQDETGRGRRMLDNELVSIIARQNTRPQLVTLIACQSATRATTDAFAGLGPKLVSVGVPAVVAMQGEVKDETARTFEATFYQRLLKHGYVDLAMNEARSTLLADERPDAAVPVLFMRLKSGQLWGAEADARGTVRGEAPQAFWEGLIDNIQNGECTPIIGPHVYGHWLPTPSEIAERWSIQYGYPFPDKSNLARVTQYLASHHGPLFPRRGVLNELKDTLIERLPQELKPSQPTGKLSLTQLIRETGWQKLTADDPNQVHRVLAGLELPLYLTTNLDSFMVEALAAREGTEPVRELCRWNAQLDRTPSEFDNDDYVPTPETPLVYHLFGTDEQRDSLVLTEDDYLHFLFQVAAERKRIPGMIYEALSSSSLLFVGYNLYDWEFRVLMHGLVANLDQRLGFKHVAVQLEFTETEDPEAVRIFLEKYFQDAHISVFLGSTLQFIAELREHWEAR